MKTITWDTNFNGKLGCDRFAHIDLAPATMPTRRQMEETIINIQVADKSHSPVVVRLDAIIPLRLQELSNLHTWPSHGMYTEDFVHWLHRRQPIKDDTRLAVYYYKKS